MSDFYSGREESFLYELLDSNDNLVGVLDSVHPGGNLDFSVSAEAKGSGSITMTKTNDIDWLTSRIRVSYVWDGNVVPLITALPSIPAEEYATTVTLKVDLRDKLAILATDKFGYSFSIAAGANIISAVLSILDSAGQTRRLIDPSSATLTGGRVWEPNDSKLKIINDLLEAAGYVSLFCDGLGNYRSFPYTVPRARPIMWIFEDLKGRGSYLPEFVRNYDPYSVPNKVIAIGKTTGATEALSSEALDYDSPYGYNARGFWLPEVITDVEGDLALAANRRLIDKRSVYETFNVTHPWLAFSIYGHENRVQFRGIDAVCQQQTWTLSEGGLIKSTLRVVV